MPVEEHRATSINGERTSFFAMGTSSGICKRICWWRIGKEATNRFENSGIATISLEMKGTSIFRREGGRRGGIIYTGAGGRARHGFERRHPHHHAGNSRGWI